MRIIGFICLSLIFCVSCGESQHDHGGKTPLVELDGNFLYREDLQHVLPQNLSTDDSLLFAQHYIRNWAEDILLYQQALQNVSNDVEIENLVYNYRKALIVHAYQQALLQERLAKELTEEELRDYYTNNVDAFKAESPLLKGLFIKVPLTAPQISQVRQWYKSGRQDAVEHLEKYSLQHAVKYEYFYDRWVSASEIWSWLPSKESDMDEFLKKNHHVELKDSASEVIGWLPLKELNFDEFLKKNRHIELKDTAFWYFLNISEYIRTGEQEPYEVARPHVRNMLLNRRQVEFMNQVKSDLYREASEDGKIKCFEN